MKKLCLPFCLLLSLLAFSQKKEIEFGQVSPEEISMDSYQKDKDAKAVVLFDKGKSIFFDSGKGYDIRFTRHKRIKIFDKSESQHAEITIPFYVDGYGKTEEVTSIEAITYNLKNGRIIKKELDPATVYEERINDRWYSKKFVFSDVQDGSILEYRYVLETPFHFNLPDWRFQDEIPTIYSEYEVGMIPFYEYVFLVQGVSNFDFQKSEVSNDKRVWLGTGTEFRDYIHTYVLKDIPAFKDESFITSINDYIIKMDFQLAKFHHPQGGTSEVISTWPKLNEALLDHDNFGKYLKRASREAEDSLEEELDLTGMDAQTKAERIIGFVKANFEWDGINQKYASQSPRDFLKKRSGNAADINLFLIAMLQEAGLEAQPLILSTRDHGKIRSDYPFDHYTNYVIALVGKQTPFLADATEDLLPHESLPTRCLNGGGLIVNKEDDAEWISLGSSGISLERQMIQLEIDSLTLNAHTRISVQSTRYDSFTNRKKFQNDTLEIKKFFSDKIGTIAKAATYGFENISAPYSMNFEGDYETEKLGKNIVIKPFLNLPVSENPLTQKDRKFPLDFVYAWEEQFETNLKIPEDYTLSDLPAPLNIDNELVSVNLNYVHSGGVLIVKGNYKFKKPIYSAEEYSALAQVFDRIVKGFNQPVVLEIKG